MRDKQSQFEELLRSHLDAAYNVAYWLIQNDPDAQKIVQKAFEQARKEFGNSQAFTSVDGTMITTAPAF